jgi:HAD superfamily hydrolase (TIGR01662 family)
MAIKVVVFDVGETLINEDRLWDGWAAYLSIEGDVFRSALLEVIANGEHHRSIFERLCPGLDIEAARRDRAARGDFDVFSAADLYPDALPCLRTLRQLGYGVGIAGNQSTDVGTILTELGVEVDFVGSSAKWGVQKPSSAFFTRVREVSKVPASSIAYVGDRLDNDVLPARAAGMAAIFIERGPWGRAHARRPEIVEAHAIITSLGELPQVLARLSMR